MTRSDNLLQHGTDVLVFDAKGHYECRGVIVGVHRCSPPVYDVQIRNTQSLSFRRCGIPEAQLRSIGNPILAYERGPMPEPKHVLDEA
jgi:hypothetical protein